ncbi:hypothetical protein [Psychrobacillus soli]|uniref:Uncharacterized protein n=1 Tax=Psychrobacillus soli TaxID=1543965 RepID=A0A544TGH0_9BACI|nr:hypothetical protein [Psychrobacillus soli]TQR16542.1 hypothetical protein FG383_06330 [Psychrobacillus soli]
MKESKVQIFSTALAMNKDQRLFVTDQYKDSLEEQKAANLHVMNCITQLENTCQTILGDIRKQEQAFNLQKKIQRQNYLHLRDIFLEMARTSNSYKSYIKKQEHSLLTMNEHINKQDNFNKLLTKRSHKQYELLNRLQQSVNKHDNYLETIWNQLQKNQLDNQTSLEKQETLQKLNEIILKNMKQQELQLDEAFEEVKNLLESVLQVKGSINTLLSTLPQTI